MSGVQFTPLFSTDNILGINEHETANKIFITTNDSVSLVKVSTSEIEKTWNQPKESPLKFTVPAIQTYTSLFSVLSHKTFVHWDFEEDLSKARTSPSELAVAQLHSLSPLLNGHVAVVFCDASISLLSKADMNIVAHHQPPSSKFQFEFSQVLTTAKGNVFTFVLARNEEKYSVFGYRIVPSTLSIGVNYSFEIPNPTNAVITSCSFDLRGFGVQWSTGFWERYAIRSADFALATSIAITSPIILPTTKGKKKLDQVENTPTTLSTHAFTHPSTLTTLNTKEGEPTLAVWSTSLRAMLLEQKVPVSKDDNNNNNNIKQLYSSRAAQFFIVFAKQVIRIKITVVEKTLCEMIGKIDPASTKPTLSPFIKLNNYLNRENKKVRGDDDDVVVELQIANSWKQEIEKESLIEEEYLSSLTSSKDAKDSDTQIVRYIQRAENKGVHPSYNYFTTALAHCIQNEFWESVNLLLLSNLVTRLMVPGLIAQLIENKNMPLIHSVITHMNNISSGDVISILKFLLSPDNKDLIMKHVKKVSKGLIYLEQESLYFILDDLIIIPLQSIVEIDDLNNGEITILLVYFQSRFTLYFSQLNFKPPRKITTQKHKQPLQCILFWLSEIFDTKSINLMSTQESYTAINDIQTTLKNQVVIGRGLSTLSGHLSFIKSSLSGGSKTLQLSKTLYTIETWPNPSELSQT